MRHLRFAAAALLAMCACSPAAQAREPRGGVQRSADKNIVDNIGDLRDAGTLKAAIKASGLSGTLTGPGPFTLFAPADEAFRKLPAGTVDNLLKPENKAQLDTVLTYHLVPGLLKLHDLVDQIKAGGGKAQLKTVQGETLTVELRGRSIEILDTKGGIARVTTANIAASNGVIQVINAVLLP